MPIPSWRLPPNATARGCSDATGEGCLGSVQFWEGSVTWKVRMGLEGAWVLFSSGREVEPGRFEQGDLELGHLGSP